MALQPLSAPGRQARRLQNGFMGCIQRTQTLLVSSSAMLRYDDQVIRENPASWGTEPSAEVQICVNALKNPKLQVLVIFAN